MTQNAIRALPVAARRAPQNQHPAKSTEAFSDSSLAQHGAETVLSILPDHEVEAELRRQIGREMYQRGHDDGYQAGVAAMSTAYKRWLLGEYDHAVLEAARYIVPCRECRRSGRRDGCTRCEVRDRETFGLPHPDDYLPTTTPTSLEAA
jgi:hypothetical protein